MAFAQPFAPPTPKPFSVLNRRNPKGNTPEALFGERLFFETRFAQFFATHCGGNVNQPLTNGDPVVKSVLNPRAGVPYPGPFAGKSINCRSCHFVEEFSRYIAGSQRSYADFAARSPEPGRDDGRVTTPRNARSMVDALIPSAETILLHADGEFSSAESLARSTLTGRELGWLPAEHKQAVAHIARIIREDDGSDALAKRYGGSYSALLMGTAQEIAAPFRLPEKYRMDVRSASDEAIVVRVSELIAAYLRSLELERDASGTHTGSAYDRFLRKNNLPAKPSPGESNAAYAQRLLREVDALQSPKFVEPYERSLRLHPHVFQFHETELKGLKVFLRQGNRAPEQPAKVRSVAVALWIVPFAGLLLWLGQGKRGAASRGTQIAAGTASVLVLWAGALCLTVAVRGATPGEAHTGNCVTCHEAPEFTDFKFHNTGAAQEEYDKLHGEGSFAALRIPSLHERQKYAGRYLPPTPQHPHALGIFRRPPTAGDPNAVDLGLWNVYANPDFPEPQAKLEKLLCPAKACDAEATLAKTIGLVRTPSLRDLGHSAPYLHTGQKAALEDVLRFYLRSSSLARAGKLRNGDPELTSINLDEDDLAALKAFLQSLDEDYDN